jgi:lambda family phage portal protein
MSYAARLATTALRVLGISRQSARHNLRSIGYDGAAGGRRLRHAGEISIPLSSQLAAHATLAKRARYLVANNGFARAGCAAWASALVGAGITAQSAAKDPDARKIVNAAWARFIDDCDVDGLADFNGLQATAAERTVVDGECFVVFVHDGLGRLRLRLMDATQVDGAYHTELARGARIVGGVEFDDAGRRIAYHAFRQRPGLPIMTSLELVRLPADDVAHLFRVETPGQVRGVSWLAAVILRLADLDQAHDAQLMRQKVAALLAGFIVDPNGEGAGFDGRKDVAGNLEGGLEPGTLKALAPGQDIRFSDPAAIGMESIEFLKITAREIAAGLGVPYESLTGDLTGVNYSSIRAGLVDFRRRAEALQHNIIVRQFCRPIWRRWLTTEILAGRLDAPGFERDPEAWLAVNWLPPKNEWVDPLKDAQAEIQAINAGLMSRRQAVAARGYDLERLDAEIAQDRQDAQALGLSFAAAAAPGAPSSEENAP